MLLGDPDLSCIYYSHFFFKSNLLFIHQSIKWHNLTISSDISLSKVLNNFAMLL